MAYVQKWFSYLTYIPKDHTMWLLWATLPHKLLGYTGQTRIRFSRANDTSKQNWGCNNKTYTLLELVEDLDTQAIEVAIVHESFEDLFGWHWRSHRRWRRIACLLHLPPGSPQAAHPSSLLPPPALVILQPIHHHLHALLHHHNDHSPKNPLNNGAQSLSSSSWNPRPGLARLPDVHTSHN